MFQFLLDVQTFTLRASSLYSIKKNLDKIFNIWKAKYIRGENKLISSYESMLCNIVKKGNIIPQFTP